MDGSVLKLEGLLETLGKLGIQYGVKLITAIVILLVGLWLAGRVTASVRKVMKIRNMDPSLQSFFSSFVSVILKILVVVIVLTTVGVQMTSIVAILGAASLAIGMALSGTLQNFAGGIVILLFKPFGVGDLIRNAAGTTGTVKKIMIFTTELHTADNQVVFLPNGPLANGEITNLTDQETRRVDLMIGIAYGDDVTVARAVALEILGNDPRILRNPAPDIFISNLSDSSVILNVRYWVQVEDYYSTQATVLEKIYQEFPLRGLHFPFPQLDVHIEK